MPAKIIHGPGKLAGPCRDPDCGHAQCMVERRCAAAYCTLCGDEIGYNRVYYTAIEYHGKKGPAHVSCYTSWPYGNKRRESSLSVL